jgi:hypothetical protein
MLITCVETAQVETGAWLNELMERSKDMPGQLTVHVYDLFGGIHGEKGHNSPPVGGCKPHKSIDSSRYCARPPPLWWPVLEQFHGGG